MPFQSGVLTARARIRAPIAGWVPVPLLRAERHSFGTDRPKIALVRPAFESCNDDDGTVLGEVLELHYQELRIRLARKLGCSDFAAEVLHDVYVQVATSGRTWAVKHPVAYLFRMAVHRAIDCLRSATLLSDAVDIDDVGLAADDACDPARIAAGRLEMQALKQALEDLPERCRCIVVGVRIEGVSCKRLAAFFGISVRRVEQELKAGTEYCRQRVQQTIAPLPKMGRQRRLAGSVCDSLALMASCLQTMSRDAASDISTIGHPDLKPVVGRRRPSRGRQQREG